MKKLAMVAGLALFASACSSGDADTDGDGEISAEEARAEMASANIKPEPGQYKMSMTFKTAEIPGAPPEMLEMLGKTMSNTIEYCLTQEEADKGFEEALTREQDDSCKITKMDMDGGTIDMAMTCEDESSGTMNITMNGDVSPTKSDLTMKMQGKIPQLGDANIEMNMKQERVGDCPA
ncbi:DUF3617 domain-containing protein [Parerythrobacter aestuarii]|uniref:DUF3617 domain-containing protein n=1 Tax=Parerythrobacter aestuarii TaxID=3020909 RepID=UPI0024DE7DDA|nr:DUF3617 domain-containing protein [Parerythrobacter aestuarii]